MSTNIWESNNICQIHGVRHKDGVMHIAAAAVPVGASFSLPEEIKEPEQAEAKE
jgi:hypothetical protein